MIIGVILTVWSLHLMNANDPSASAKLGRKLVYWVSHNGRVTG